MSKHVLWPFIRWTEGREEIEMAHLAEYGFTGEIVDRVPLVTDEQWRRADAIISKPDAPPEKREIAENCRIFVTSKTGYENINLEAWGALGVPVCNVPNYGTTEVADHAIGLLMAINRNVVVHTNVLQADIMNNWDQSRCPFGKRLSCCTLGIIGLGRIGTAAALRAKTFGMDIVFYDPYVRQGVDRSIGVRRVDSVEELVAQCDYVSLHATLNDETFEIINERTLAAAKPGIVIINTARGQMVDLDALYSAMKDGRVMAAALDVLPEEPKLPGKPGNPLKYELIRAWSDREEWIKDRLILTSHVGYLSPESSLDMRTMPIDIVAQYLNNGLLYNCVNEKYLKFQR
ncbi:MAG: hypothetical protein JXA42_19570 [Anaerolineales bacterium]|nr:hypothetical protein [Anaerolineales bacterium]